MSALIAINIVVRGASMTADGADFYIIVVGADARARIHCRRQLAWHPPVQVLVECERVEELALAPVQASDHGVVVLAGSYSGPTGDMSDQIRGIRRALPMMPVLVVSQPPPVVHAHIAGWLSFGSPVDLAAAVSVVASGGWIGDRVAALASLHAAPPQLTLITKSGVSPHAPVPLATLTARENQVLTLLAQGMTNPAIAGALHITADTVKSHVRHIMQKLHVRDRTEAAVVAVRAKIA
jgi:DNA-binding NarL/FixJ family response regulator